ncbi:MAG: deoxyribodipyrimidine photo-lyase [Actinomycetota bacterium]|nr:deoxyribodipyrimidine photo-lyase [Actinomycetota bacterium]
MGSRAVIWFRRDLRLDDNRALIAAAKGTHEGLLPVFVMDPNFLKISTMRTSYLMAVLRSLNDELDGRLNLIYSGDPTAIVDFAISVGADAIYGTSDFSPLGIAREKLVKERAATNAVVTKFGDSPYLIPPGRLSREQGGWYKVFTPFYKALMKHGYEDPLDLDSSLLSGRLELVRRDDEASLHLAAPVLFSEDQFPPSTSRALASLYNFLERTDGRYKELRDFPAVEGTTKLSAALRFGVIHPRQIVAAAFDAPGGEPLVREVVWRDFYANVLYQMPHTTWKNFNPNFDHIEVDSIEDPAKAAQFEAWKAGKTGYPIVDSAMRQLNETGWMHNRLRMIAASFLVKDIHLPWQLGAKYFMERLLDGDIASNNHSWQWVAGSGTDAAPYFRIFNPIIQSEKFDPEGQFIKRYVPELAQVSAKAIHDPFNRGAAGVYVNPILDHNQARNETLDRYQRLRELFADSETKKITRE